MTFVKALLSVRDPVWKRNWSSCSRV